MKYFYVTAIDGKRVFFMAGPFSDHETALSKVPTVRKIACDPDRNAQYGRAAFMSYGTVSRSGKRKTALGVDV